MSITLSVNKRSRSTAISVIRARPAPSKRAEVAEACSFE
jgi:hypothetical protein